jgi:hypothetical protein
MNTSKLQWLTDDIATQVPRWMREFDGDYDKFIIFLELYYEWMAQEGNPLEVLSNLLKDSDIDNVSNKFAELYISEMAHDMPKVITTNNLIEETNETNVAKNKFISKNKFSSSISYSSDNFLGNGIVSEYNLSYYEPSYYNDKDFLQKVDDITVYVNPLLGDFFIPMDMYGVVLLSNQVNETNSEYYDEIAAFGSRRVMNKSEILSDLRFNPNNTLIAFPRFVFTLLDGYNSLSDVDVTYRSRGWLDGIYLLNVGGFNVTDNGQNGTIQVVIESGSVKSVTIVDVGSGYTQNDVSLRVDFFNNNTISSAFGLSTQYSILPKFKFELDVGNKLSSVSIDDEGDSSDVGAVLHNQGYSLIPGKYIVDVIDSSGDGYGGQIEIKVSQHKIVDSVTILSEGQNYTNPTLSQYSRNSKFTSVTPLNNTSSNISYTYEMSDFSVPQDAAVTNGPVFVAPVSHLSNILLEKSSGTIVSVQFENGFNESCSVSGSCSDNTIETESECLSNGEVWTSITTQSECISPAVWGVPWVVINDVKDILAPYGTTDIRFSVVVPPEESYTSIDFDINYNVGAGDFVKLPRDYYKIEDGVLVFKSPLGDTRMIPKSQTVIRVLYRISTSSVSKSETESRSIQSRPNIKVNADRKNLIKFMREFYNNKGTEKSYKFLFNLFFQKGVDFYYPKGYTFKPSDNTWVNEQTIRCAPYINRLGNMVNYTDDTYNPRFVKGTISGCVATIDRHESYMIGNNPVEEYFVTNINGKFKSREDVIITDINNEEFIENLYEVVESVDIIDGGSNYTVGQSLSYNPITLGSGSGFECFVGSVGTGVLSRVSVISPGSGYISGELIEFGNDGTGGTGAVGVVGECENPKTFNLIEFIQDPIIGRRWSYDISQGKMREDGSSDISDNVDVSFDSSYSHHVEVSIGMSDNNYLNNILLLDFQNSAMIGNKLYNFGSNNFIDYANFGDNKLTIEKNSVLLGSFGHHDGYCEVIKNNRIDPTLSNISDYFHENGSIDISTSQDNIGDFVFSDGYGLSSGNYFVSISNGSNSTRGTSSPAYLPVIVATSTDGVSSVTIVSDTTTQWISGFNIDKDNYVVDYAGISTNYSFSYEYVRTHMLNENICLSDGGSYTHSNESAGDVLKNKSMDVSNWIINFPNSEWKFNTMLLYKDVTFTHDADYKADITTGTLVHEQQVDTEWVHGSGLSDGTTISYVPSYVNLKDTTLFIKVASGVSYGSYIGGDIIAVEEYDIPHTFYLPSVPTEGHVFGNTKNLTFGDDGNGYVKINGVGSLITSTVVSGTCNVPGITTESECVASEVGGEWTPDNLSGKYTFDLWYRPVKIFHTTIVNSVETVTSGWKDEVVIFSLASQYRSDTPNKITLLQREVNNKLKIVLVLGDGDGDEKTEFDIDVADNIKETDYDNIEVSDSSWFHIAVEIDFTDTTASLYINGRSPNATTQDVPFTGFLISDGPYADNWQDMIYSWKDAIEAVVHEMNSIADANIITKDQTLKSFLSSYKDSYYRWDINEDGNISGDVDIIYEMLSNKKYYWSFYTKIIQDMLLVSYYNKYFKTEGTRLEDEFLIGAKRSIISEYSDGELLIPTEGHNNADYATFRITRGHRFDKYLIEGDITRYLFQWSANPILNNRTLENSEYSISDAVEVGGSTTLPLLRIYKPNYRIVPIMSQLTDEYWTSDGKLNTNPIGVSWSDIIFSNGYGLVSGIHYVIISSQPYLISDTHIAAKIPVNVVFDIDTGISTVVIIPPDTTPDTGNTGSGGVWSHIGQDIETDWSKNIVQYYALTDIEQHNIRYSDKNLLWDDVSFTGYIKIPLMLPDWTTISLKYFNVSEGGIKSIHLHSSGSGYRSLPSASVSSKSGNYISKGYGAQLTCKTNDIGSITQVHIGNYISSYNRANDFGVGYDVLPILDLTDKGDGNAVLKLNGGVICKRQGYSFSNKDSFPSNQVRVQDSNLWQDYSYVLRSTVTIDKWRDVIKKVIHPVGFAVFGEFILDADVFKRKNKTTAITAMNFNIIKNVEITVDVMDGLGIWTKGLKKDIGSGDIIHKTDAGPIDVNNLYSGGHHDIVLYDNLQSTLHHLGTLEDDDVGVTSPHEQIIGRYGLFSATRKTIVSSPVNDTDVFKGNNGFDYTIDLTHIDQLEIKSIYASYTTGGSVVPITNYDHATVEVSFDNKVTWNGFDLVDNRRLVNVPTGDIGYAKFRVSHIETGVKFSHVEVLRWSYDFGIGGSYASDTVDIYWADVLDDTISVDTMAWSDVRYVGLNHKAFINTHYTKYRPDQNLRIVHDMESYYKSSNIIGTNFTIYKNRSISGYNTSSWNWGKFVVESIDATSSNYIVFTVKHIASAGNLPNGSGASGDIGPNDSQYDYPNNVEFRFDSISRSGVEESTNYWVGSYRRGADVRDDKMVIRLDKYWQDIPSLGVTTKSLERLKFRFLSGNEYRDVLNYRFTDKDEVLLSPHILYKPTKYKYSDTPDENSGSDYTRIYTDYKRVDKTRILIDMASDIDGDHISDETLWSYHNVSNTWKYENVDTTNLLRAVSVEIINDIVGLPSIDIELQSFLKELVNGFPRWDINVDSDLTIRDFLSVYRHMLEIQEYPKILDFIIKPALDRNMFDHYLFKNQGITDYSDHLWPTSTINSIESLYERNYHAVLDSALSIVPKRLFVTPEQSDSSMITLGMNYKGLERMKFYNTPQWYVDNDLDKFTIDDVYNNFHERINIGHESIVNLTTVNAMFHLTELQWIFIHNEINVYIGMLTMTVPGANIPPEYSHEDWVGANVIDNADIWTHIYTTALLIALENRYVHKFNIDDINNRNELIS